MSAVRAAVFGVLAGAVVVGVSLWPGNLPLLWAVALGLPAAALTALGTRMSGPLEPLWTAVPDEPSSGTQMQAANLATRLAEAARDRDRFATRVQPRLRGLALATLRARYPDISTMDDPRVRLALGAELHDLLTSPTAVLPTPRRLAELLDRLEEA